MLKKLIVLIAVLFIGSCNLPVKYIELSGEDFKQELVSFVNSKSDNCFWVYLMPEAKNNKYFNFQLNCLNIEKKNSVINITKKVKVNKKEIKVYFDTPSSMATRIVLPKNISAF